MAHNQDLKYQLKKVFNKLVLRYTDDAGYVDSLWDEVETSYSGKDRHYHNLVHLNNLLLQLSEVKPQIQDWDAVLFALFYHDLIYNPVRRDNEKKSAKRAAERLETLNFPAAGIDKCVRLILATQGHITHDDHDVNLFTDADLSVLGSDSDQYLAYTQQVRKEYHIYPDLLYKPGRKKVLVHFLNMDRIFKTDHFYDKYETQARQNLSNELKGL